jgi:hypothetical protein
MSHPRAGWTNPLADRTMQELQDMHSYYKSQHEALVRDSRIGPSRYGGAHKFDDLTQRMTNRLIDVEYEIALRQQQR